MESSHISSLFLNLEFGTCMCTDSLEPSEKPDYYIYPLNKYFYEWIILLVK